MKIGIITIFKANNYGAELQGFALQEKLKLMGYEAELIDYPFYKHKSYVRSQISKPLFNIGFRNRLKEFLLPHVQTWCNFTVRDEVFSKYDRMDEFHHKYTRLSKASFRSMEDLYAADLPYDLFMVGSDQVWNPRMNSSLDPYFLTFAPAGKPRVSYASSFGVSILPEHTKKLFADRLSTFTALSVREKQGVAIIKELIGKDVEHVLDPTLLLSEDEWSKVAVPPQTSSPYVLIYEVMPCAYLATVAKQIAGQVPDARVARVRGGSGIKKKLEIDDINDAGPSEFVGLFKAAAAIVTNSFHGTAFAINFGKPIYPVLPSRMRNASRIVSLLDLVGLENRLILEGDNSRLPELPEIDLLAVRDKLNRARTQSENYLKRALVPQ